MTAALSRLITTLRKPVEIDEGRLAEQRERGERAEALARDELFQEALSEIEGVYMRAWKASDALDVEKRERCHMAVLLLEDLKNQLVSYVRDGAVARERLEHALRQ